MRVENDGLVMKKGEKEMVVDGCFELNLMMGCLSTSFNSSWKQQ